MRQRRVKVFFDGGCRPNPGPMEAAVVVRGRLHLFEEIGTGTNTDAEWAALILALELSQASSFTDVELIGDSLEVIRQANAALAHGNAAQGQAARFLALAGPSPPVRIRWIKRQQNLAGIALDARRFR